MSASKSPKKGSTVSSKTANPNTVGSTDANGSTDTVTSSTNTVTSSTSPSTNSNGSLIFIAQCTAHLDAAATALPPGENLTVNDKKRQGKAKKGGERVIPQLLALARDHGLSSIPQIPLDEIINSNSEAQALAPLEQKLGRLHKQVTDRLFYAQSVSWGHSTALYSVLRRLSKNNGELQAGLAPLADFFSARHKSVVTVKTLTRLEARTAKLAKQHELAKAKSDAAAMLAAAKSAAKSKTTAASPVVEPAVTPVVEPVVAPAEKPVPVTSSVASNGAGAANGATHA